MKMKTDVDCRQAEPEQSFDRRRHPRYRWSIPIAVHRLNQKPVAGMSIELSESGMSAVISDALEVGEMVKIEPVANSGASAVVRRRTGKVYGFEFIDLSPAHAQKIREVCKCLYRYQPRSLQI